MKKNIIYSYLSVIALGVLSGCSLFEQEVIPQDTTTPYLVIDKLSGNIVSFEHKVGANLLVSSYDSGDIQLENWRITDSKTININLSVKEQEKGTEMLVEHVHADMSIKSQDPQLNGLTQDSMDNAYHGTSQDGFLIDKKYGYKNTFAIEGFSKDLIEGWGFYAGSYGSSGITTKRLTEESLFRNMTYGSQLTVVYNLLVKNSGEEKYHIETFEDHIIIPTILYTQAIEKQQESESISNKTQN